MGLSSKAGSFAANTSTGNQAISGIGFQPKVIIFFGNTSTSDGSAADCLSYFGAGISSSSRRSVASCTKDGQNPFTTESANRDDACITIVTGSSAGAAGCRADFVSQDSDGFTINWITAPAAAFIVNYIALGGTDLTNVALGSTTPPSSTGNSAVTGVGFRPDAILVFHGIDNSATPPSDDITNNYHTYFGFATASTERGYVSIRASTGTGSRHRQSKSNLLAPLSSAGVFYQADLVSFDSDGFTLNFSTAEAGDNPFFWLVLKGGKFKVGSVAQPTSTGNQATTGIGFQPNTLLLMSANDTAANDDSTLTGLRASIGAASSTTDRTAIWRGLTDTTAPSVAKQNLDRTKVIKMITEGSTPTVNAAADLNSFDSDGFTLNWTTADATARELLFIAIGPVPVVGALISFSLMDGGMQQLFGGFQ